MRTTLPTPTERVERPSATTAGPARRPRAGWLGTEDLSLEPRGPVVRRDRRGLEGFASVVEMAADPAAATSSPAERSRLLAGALVALRGAGDRMPAELVGAGAAVLE